MSGKITLMRGPSGSGKSTWAESQVGAVVVSRDALRVAFFGSDGPVYYMRPDLKACEDYITKVEEAAVAAGLRAGKHVISDNTYIEPKYMKRMVNIAYKAGATIESKVFDVPLRTLIERNEQRAMFGGRNVPEDVIRKQHDRFQHTKNIEIEVPAPMVPYTGTPGKPMAFMYDLDGTTYHMGDKRGPYDHNVDVDDPDPVVQDMVNRFAESGLIAIAMSGRKSATREKTEEALNRDGCHYDYLFMRADDDNRPDNLIKYDLFNEFVRDNFDVQFVLDDRNQVVDMWRTLGIKCAQVAEGDF